MPYERFWVWSKLSRMQNSALTESKIVGNPEMLPLMITTCCSHIPVMGDTLAQLVKAFASQADVQRI